MANSKFPSGSARSPSESSTENYAHLDGMEWSDLTDLNLLSTLLSLTSQEVGGLPQAEEILRSAGSLSQVTKMRANELHDLIPRNPKAIAFINLLRLSIQRIVNERTSHQIRLNSPAAMAEYVATHRNPAAAGNRRIVLLDRDGRLIRDFSMSMSKADVAFCRVIAQEALEVDAFGLIVIEYLFSDTLNFSVKTNRLFEMLQESMTSININLYDYLIIGINRYLSKNENRVVNLYKT